MSDKVFITDTILRDAHQCTVATRLRTDDMLPICEKLDQIGYWSLEVWGGATFDACIRYLKEDPWERLRRLRRALPNTRLQMLLRGQNLLGYRHYSDDVVKAFVARAVANGIDVFRIFDALNDVRNLEVAIRAVKKHNKHAQAAICYTVSPVHSIDQFIHMARSLEQLGCDSIVVKDMAGLLTPYVTASLFKQLHAAVKLPVHLHSHATAGLAELCQLKAIEAGCRHIDTAISAFSGGASHPPTESMIAAFRDTPYDTGLDLERVQEIGVYFYQVRKKYWQFESEFTGIDTRVQVNQVPGGMISNLYTQLKEQGAVDRMAEVLKEIPHVRRDLGYPPLVTPTSQIVGSQAVINVLTGTRYKSISNEVKLYLQGRYGAAPGEVNEEVRRNAIGDEPVIDVRPADLIKPEMENLRTQIGALAESEEDVLIFAMFPELGRDFLQRRRDHTLVPEPLQSLKGTSKDSSATPVEFNITLHGEHYHIKLTGAGYSSSTLRPFYLTVDGVPEEVVVETLSELPSDGDLRVSASGGKTGKRPKATRPGHVTAAMPCTLIEVRVKIGDQVKAGDTVLVCEAMKMETEVHAAIDGIVKALYVEKGDSVNPDETLIEIE